MENSLTLNTIKGHPDAKTAPKRKGRGPGSGQGKTCGRGVKGQKSRSGGYHKVGFEGGQMPLQRRLPKVGFRSRKSLFTTQLRLGDLKKVNAQIVDITSLREANLIRFDVKRVKVILNGEVDKAFTIGKGVAVTKGAKAAIEKAGGKVLEEGSQE